MLQSDNAAVLLDEVKTLKDLVRQHERRIVELETRLASLDNSAGKREAAADDNASDGDNDNEGANVGSRDNGDNDS